MGNTNKPTNLLDRIKAAEQEIKKVRGMIGLASATIARGGLTLIQDAFLRMIDDAGVEVIYFGPDEQGRQIIRMRREGGSDVFWTGFTLAGNQFWRLTDRFTNRELFSDDTETGGIGRPWLSCQIFPQFAVAAGVYSYMNLPVASVTSETVLWQGRIPLITHSWISCGGIFGQASGANSSTYRLKLGVAATTVGTWSETALVNANRGPFNISAFLGDTDVPVVLTAIATGTGLVGCQVYSLYQRQT